jgi:hypothetical protein
VPKKINILRAKFQSDVVFRQFRSTYVHYKENVTKPLRHRQPILVTNFDVSFLTLYTESAIQLPVLSNGKIKAMKRQKKGKKLTQPLVVPLLH